MRKIHISNEKKRDAEVGFLIKGVKSRTSQVLENGGEFNNIRVLRSTLNVDIGDLSEKFEQLNDLGEEIIKGDPEIDMEKMGMFIKHTRRIYLDNKRKICYRLKFEEIIKEPDGTEKERKPLTFKDANIANEFPVRWTGKLIPKKKAVSMFVLSRKYQLQHVNGLTYDFLYDMAKKLHEADSLMFLGGGEKGNEPLVFSHGGLAYRAFLDGRIEEQKYCLILHLTNLELKEFTK